MTAKAVQEDALLLMVQTGAIRECLVCRVGDKWGFSVRLGGSGSKWLPVRSRREPVRTWASLTAVGRFADSLGVRSFIVEL